MDEEQNRQTALAQPAAQRCGSSGQADAKVFRNELTACLALVAPVGMSEEARGEWLAVAWATLKHLPPDILVAGCKAARQKCDHHAKIVPTIIAETKQRLEWRTAPKEAPFARLPRPDYVSPDAADDILREYGLKGAFDA